MKQYLLYLYFLLPTIFWAQNYNYLGTYTSNGTPNYLVESDVITPETIQMVKNSLPENYPVPTYNPHYISAGYDNDLQLTAQADVWVTFVSEGAGYRNVLGFYTYSLDNPKTTKPTPEEITIIFPNVSALGSGGGLLAGNKVKIGTFPAGTGIGWVLLANAWNGSAVTNGQWQLFSNEAFNPEADPTLQYHNVLLADEANERFFLGFEDIRRDYSSCDNDFNDAIFYVTANPYSAIKSSNVVDIKTATNITSANNGGLESNGDLASLIAQRNFNRIKNNSFFDKKGTQKKYAANKGVTFKSTNGVIDLGSLFPKSGMFGTEESYTSSPTDLVQITNASNIFSVDYYQGDQRVAAALATATFNKIYDHSKVICDRLNNSVLEDIRTITMGEHQIIMIIIKRSNGSIEYAVHFSIKLNEANYELLSFWNMNDYPQGDYLNFQIWGSSMGQVSAISNAILSNLEAEKEILSNSSADKIPTVFVKNGTYKKGKLHLTIKNTAKSNQLLFDGNIRTNEFASTENKTFHKILSSNLDEQELVIDVNNLFDIGFSIKGNNSIQKDELYLADGPWGIDYLANETTITTFKINTETENFTDKDDAYFVERSVLIEGEILGTANVFRTILPGELLFDVTQYNMLEFNIQNSLPIEIILITEDLSDWNNRLRVKIPINLEEKMLQINLSDFKDQYGQLIPFSKIKGVVFSVQGNYTNFTDFSLAVNSLSFKNLQTLSTNSIAQNETSYFKLVNYPNPFTEYTTLVLPKNTKTANVLITDYLGRVVYNTVIQANLMSNEVKLNLNNINTGVYKCIVITDDHKKMQTSIVKR